MDKEHKSKLERSPWTKENKNQAQAREEWRHFVRKNSPGTALHAGIQIANKEGAIKSIFVVHRAKHEVSFH